MMNWQCPHCHISLELPEGTGFAFCPACGVRVKDVKPEPAKPKEEPQPPEESVCPVCCSPILPGEEKLVCPDCRMTYHQDCWNDNNGCATYGCPSVGCLNPPPIIIDEGELGGETVCPHCGVSQAPGATFCWSCGHDLTAKEKVKKQEQEDVRWDPLHPGKFWRTNKWWMVSSACCLLLFGYARTSKMKKVDPDAAIFLLIVVLVAVVTGVIGYIKNVGWNRFIHRFIHWTLLVVGTIAAFMAFVSCLLSQHGG